MTETTAAPAPAEAKPNHGLSLADAVAKMRERRVSAAAPAPAPTVSEPAADASNPEPGETTEAISVEGDEQPEAAEAETDQTAQAEAAGEDDGIEVSDDTVFVFPDGERRTWKEVQTERMLQRDYTRKTQANAEEKRSLAADRQTLESERRAVADKAKELDTTLQQELAAAKAERERYAAAVAEVEKALNPGNTEWANVDWEMEAQRDPNWQLKFARFQKWQHAMELTRAEKADLAAKAKADAEAADKAAKESAAQAWHGQRLALEQHITSRHADLLDPEKGKQEFRAMAATAEAAGIPGAVFLAALGHAPQEGVPIMAAPVFELLRKATRLDQLLSEQTKALASDKAPKPDATGKIKVVKAGAARFRSPTPTDSALGRAQAAFNANSSPQNAAALMAARRAAAAAKQAR